MEILLIILLTILICSPVLFLLIEREKLQRYMDENDIPRPPS